jgi:FrmR/RcnR family transcriptional regulator, repressor of frmRAB operon
MPKLRAVLTPCRRRRRAHELRYWTGFGTQDAATRQSGALSVKTSAPGREDVSHTSRDKVKLLNRVRRIRGQIEAVERALEQEIGCADVLQLIAGARGAINGLMQEVMEDHIRMHVLAPGPECVDERTQAAEELIEVVRTYLK